VIVVCGEALIDLFAGEPAADGIACRAVAGGSPFNLAVGLARLGRSVGFLGGLSTDPFGRHLRNRLAAEGVRLDLAVDRPERTTLSVVSTDAEGHPAYAFHGEGAADRALGPGDAPASFGDDVTCLTIGSFSLSVEPIASTLEGLVRREAGRRAVSLDPNLRPQIVGDVAAWRPRFERFLALSTIVKASDEDVVHLHGAAADPDTVVAGWLDQGPALVLLTRGGRGATAWHRTGRFDRAAARTTVVDTVGAGDSFQAALLAHLEARGTLSPAGVASLDGAAVAEALATAVTAAGITCGRRGADPPDAAALAAALAAQ
jgi:fructokinase